jgi:hypothetical protein
LKDTILSRNGASVILRKIAMTAHKNPALPNREGLMSEVELDLMLDALRMVMAAAEQQDVLRFNESPRTAWPIIPFPEGWYAG